MTVAVETPVSAAAFRMLRPRFRAFSIFSRRLTGVGGLPMRMFLARARSSPATTRLLRIARSNSAYGSVSDGFLGALERVGGHPLPRPRDYLLLHSFFADPGKRLQARALQHCGPISKLTLDAVAVLESKLLHPNILIHAESLKEVIEFQAAIRLLQAMPDGPTDEVVSQSLSAMGPRSKLAGVVATLVRRAPAFQDQPVGSDSDFTPLDSADALIAASRRFKNCLRHKVLGALIGRVAYAVFRGNSIAEFRRLGGGGGWLLYDVHAPMNDHVGRELRTAVAEACAARGLPHLADRLVPSDWDPLISLAEVGGLYDFEFADDRVI